MGHRVDCSSMFFSHAWVQRKDQWQRSRMEILFWMPEGGCINDHSFIHKTLQSSIHLYICVCFHHPALNQSIHQFIPVSRHARTHSHIHGYTYIQVSFHPFIQSSKLPSNHWSIHIYTHPFVHYPSMHPSKYSFIYSYIHPSIHLSIHLLFARPSEREGHCPFLRGAHCGVTDKRTDSSRGCADSPW